MSLLTILGIAVALAMDAFAVAIATGVNLDGVVKSPISRVAGFWQALDIPYV